MKYHNAHEIFRILLTNLLKCLEKIYLLLQSKSRQRSREKKKKSLQGAKSIFVVHFWTLVNKIEKNVMCIKVLHVKLKPQLTNSEGK
jgi:hypothetical protein